MSPDPLRDVLPVESQPRPLRRLVLALSVVAVLIAVTGTVFRLLTDWAELPWGIGAVVTQSARLFSPNTEGNAWSWYATILLAALSIVFVIIGSITRRGGGDGRPYVVLAVVAAFLSVDESSQIHEHFGLITGAFDVGTGFTYNWLIIGIPLAIVVGVLLLWVTRRIDRRLRRGLVLGGAVYLGGAAGVEMLGGMVFRSFDTEGELVGALLANGLMLLEELAEFTGVIISLTAALAMLRQVDVPEGVFVRLRAEGRGASTRSAP